jgi:hypothetical protein
LRQLVVLQCFGNTVADLVEGSRIDFFVTQVDTSQARCGNIVCPEHGKASIGHVRVYRDKRNCCEIAQLTCTVCDQTVSRVLHGDGPADDRIIDRGELWRSTLATLWADTSMSLRQISRRLDADPLTVKRHAVETGLSFPRLSKRPSVIAPVRKVEKIITDDYRNDRRQRWLQALRSGATSSAARHLVPAIYAWLYRHDRGWLREVAPARAPLSDKCARSVDWASREREFLNRVESAVYRIVGRRPYVQCSLLMLAREIRAERTLKYLDRMPTLRNQLLELAEDRGRYALRKIAAIAEEGLVGQTVDQVRRAAGLRAETVKIPAVRQYIEKCLAKKVQNSIISGVLGRK